METGQKIGQVKLPAPFHIRKLARSGNSRQISIGSIVPLDWIAVKLVVLRAEEGVRDIRLIQIK